MRSVAILLASVVMPVLLSAPLTAEVVVIQAAADNTLYQNANGDRSNGSGAHFFAGRLGQRGAGLSRRGAIRFDVASALPAGAVVTSVALELNLSNEATSGNSVSLHRASDDWGEGASTDPSGNGMGGIKAEDGDATWLYRFFDTDLWLRQGGDFAGQVSASTSVGGLGRQVWGPTDAMREDVQSWLDRPSQNFGWIVVGDETRMRSVKRFDSRENPEVGNRPRLTVEYEAAPATSTPPAPPTRTPEPTASPSVTPTRRPATPTPTIGPCVGDCDRDGTIRIAELVRGVNIALGLVAVDQCGAFDVNLSGRVEISELIAAVNGALRGCLAISGS